VIIKTRNVDSMFESGEERVTVEKMHPVGKHLTTTPQPN
jgi:hypothetical protein